MSRVRTTTIQVLVCGLLLASARDATADFAGHPAGKNLVQDGPAFEVDLGASDLTVCFVFPEQRRNEIDCAGVDIASVKAKLGSVDRSSLLAAAILHSDESETMVMVLRPPLEMAKLSPSDVPKSSRDVLKGMAKAAPGVEFVLAQPARLLQVGALQVLHLRVDIRLEKGAPPAGVFTDSYFVLTEGSTRLLEFFTLSSEMPAIEPVMERLVQGVRGKPTQKLLSLTAEELGYYLGLFAGPILLVLLMLVGGYVLVRRSMKRRHSD